MSVSVEQIGTWIGLVLGGGAAAKAIEVLAKRATDKTREPAEMTFAAAEFQKALTGGAKDLIDHLVSETASLRARQDDLQDKADVARSLAEEAKAAARILQAQHEHCEAELEDGRRERATLRAKIDELMDGRVAAMHPTDNLPKDPA